MGKSYRYINLCHKNATPQTLNRSCCKNPIRSKTFPREEFIFELCSVKVGYLAVSGTTDLLACQFFIVNHDLRFPGTVGISSYLEHSPSVIKNLISFDKLKQGAICCFYLSQQTWI